MFRTTTDGRFAIVDHFRISNASFHSQSKLEFAALKGGGFIAVWMDSSDADYDHAVRGQRFDSNGGEVGEEFFVNQNNARLQGDPAVTALATGGFLVTWVHETSGEGVFDIRGQIFDASGARVGNEFAANTTTFGFDTAPSVAALSGGGFVVAWEHAEETGEDHVRAQVFTASGAKVGGEIVATDTSPGDKVAPDVIALNGGGFVVGWYSWGPGPRAQLFDNAGNKVGSAFSIKDQVAGLQSTADFVALPGGGFVATWADDGGYRSGSNTGSQGIWVQIFDGDGSRVGGPVRASGAGSPRGDAAAIEVLPGSGFIVTWKAYNSSTGFTGHTRAQAFDFNGSKVGAEIVVNPDLSSDQHVPEVVGLANGAFFVGWEYNDTASERDISGRMFFRIRHGTDGNDSYAGTANRDFYMGNAGIDTLSGGGKADGISGGAGNDVLRGDSGDDTLDGDSGDDRLDGGTGNDVMAGGAGNDTYVVGSVLDVTNETSSSHGTADTVFSNVSHTLAMNVERLTLTGTSGISGTGNSLSNIMIGNSGVNRLEGGSGNDSLNGGAGSDRLNGGVGIDVMTGGTGNDAYVVDNILDKVNEISSSDGTADTVFASIGYTLGAHLEKLTLTGTASIAGNGNDQANVITGNGAANRLNGGVGNDVMNGGAGNDSYLVESAGDKVIERSGGGADTVESGISYILSPYVENLKLTGTSAINGTGNSLTNTIIGNATANILDGKAGADKLVGNGGNDIYIVDNAADVVTEASSAGTDTIKASATEVLAANIENLILTGTAAINGTGNGSVNTITGNGAANIVDGKVGADKLAGGGGNDTYIVDNISDLVTEATSAGADTIKASVTETLAANVEKLVLTGTAAINGTGNGGANTIIGNGAANKLNGDAGKDVLSGGAGADRFLFDTTLNASTNWDDILDFSVAADTIELDRTIFTKILVNGTLTSNAFITGTAAADAADRIVYDKVTGNIFYDSDGNGAAAKVLFAQVNAGTVLTNADFFAVA